ncbi:MAG: class I SAM-dependent methyltransferase [Desulfobulbaceae bacterium]|nr:class I SAM-dependent methyltransferase [Desulfobulbaceae bacterium]
MLTDIAVAAQTPKQHQKAAHLAKELGIPVTEPTTSNHSLLLVVTEERLELRQCGPKAPGPVWVDFTGGKTDYRRRRGGGRKQTLVRAIGVKGKNLPTVLDATAGLGQDSFVLACQGCRVEMMERNPVIAALLEDGLRRAADDPAIGKIVRARMVLSSGDSLTELAKIPANHRPQVVYLDPMFPHRSKSALVKKEMRILRTLVGDDEDSDQLLTVALRVAHKRVVVKRPAYAPPLNGPKPDLAFKSKNNRFDVYLL